MIRLERTVELAVAALGNHALRVLGWCSAPHWLDADPPTWEWPR